jgi:hypothetical protein
MIEDTQILTGLLWIASMPVNGQPSPFERCELTTRGVGSMRRAGVPEALIADAYRADLQPTDALAAAQRWAHARRPRQTWEAPSLEPHAPRSRGVLVLRGSVGTGKSAAMAKLLALRVAAGLWRARWVDCRGLVSTDWDKVNALDDLVDVPCLMLDDMSAAMTSREGARKAIMALLGQRHEKQRLTVITSNLDKDALEVAAEVAVWDRVTQDGEVVACEGSSLRGTVERVDLDTTIADASRLVQLVARCAAFTRSPAHQDRSRVTISDEVLYLPIDEAVKQLGRLLGVSGQQARQAAAEVDAHDAKCRELGAELEAKLAGALRQVAANGPHDTAENEAARAASKARAIELLEQGDDESPAEVAERKRIAANLECEAKRR